MHKNKQAFTLVELIVVITILAILGTIAFISLQGYSVSSRDSVRISDVGNMKTSLELFHLDAGKYTLPDNYEEVSYSGKILWYQGTFGTTVVSQLSRNMSEIPTDPLTEKEYVFSTANNKNEFEILTLLEGEVSLNTISKTNAATLTVIPKIDGNYNGVFIKTLTHIVPTPSIINSEVNGATLILNNTNIKSQVTNLGKNIPNVGNVITATGKLIGLEIKEILLPAIDAKPIEKAAVITLIQEAYTGCTDLLNNDIYEYILGISGEGELAGVFNTIVLKDITNTVDNTPVLTAKTVTDCGTGIWTNTGSVIYGTLDGLADGTDILTCNDDIIVCNGITGSGYTIAACNAGAITVYINQTFPDTIDGIQGDGSSSDPRTGSINEWAGGLYQWGNNADNSYTIALETTSIITTPVVEDSLYSSIGFIKSNLGNKDDWINPQQDNLWGNGTDTNLARKGPCQSDYHVPSHSEWQKLVELKWDLANANLGSDMSNDLKIPMGGFRSSGSANIVSQDSRGYYSSSSTDSIYRYYMLLNSTDINPDTSNRRAYGFSVRCFKN